MAGIYAKEVNRPSFFNTPSRLNEQAAINSLVGHVYALVVQAVTGPTH